MRLGSHSPHLPQDAGLVTHRPPGVGEAHGEVKRCQNGNGGRIAGDEVQRATAGATVRLGDVAILIVHSDPESEAVPEQEQMPSGAAANIDHPHPNCRHRRAESYAVRANPILGGLHHEYYLAPDCA